MDLKYLLLLPQQQSMVWSLVIVHETEQLHIDVEANQHILMLNDEAPESTVCDYTQASSTQAPTEG